jgi:hypothetical protein
VGEKRKSADFAQPPASRQHFDIWQFQKAEGDSSYFGRMPPQIVEISRRHLQRAVSEPDAGGHACARSRAALG